MVERGIRCLREDMNHTDKIVRIREIRDFVIPIYDQEDDEVAKAKAMEMVENMKQLHCMTQRRVVSVETNHWDDAND